MRNEYSNTDRLAMLFELGLNYHEEINMAMDKKDKEKALYLIDLDDCIRKLMKDIEERGAI